MDDYLMKSASSSQAELLQFRKRFNADIPIGVETSIAKV